MVVLGPCHWYLWQRLVRDLTPVGRWRIVATAMLGMLAATLLVAFSRRVREVLPFPTMVLIGYLWVVIVLYLVLTLLVLEIPRLFVVRADPSRRELVSRGAAIVAGLSATSVVGYGAKTAYGPPVLKRLDIPLSKLPRSMDGYRIALVADIHLGSLTRAGHARRIVDAINSMNPDLIAVVGDLADGSVQSLHAQALPLRDLSSKDGAFFVTGNHEYFSGVDEWVDEVVELGMRPLRNERLEIRGLDLAGVDDVTGDPDYGRALGGRDLAKPVILLAHQPVSVREAARFGVDLQLSGHTHGGQIFPFHLVVRSQHPVVSGLGEVDGTKVYVTNGAGFWGPPVRVGAPPDITLVQLRATGNAR